MTSHMTHTATIEERFDSLLQDVRFVAVCDGCGHETAPARKARWAADEHEWHLLDVERAALEAA